MLIRNRYCNVGTSDQAKKTARLTTTPTAATGDAGERRGEFEVATGRLDQWGVAEDEQE